LPLRDGERSREGVSCVYGGGGCNCTKKHQLFLITKEISLLLVIKTRGGTSELHALRGGTHGAI